MTPYLLARCLLVLLLHFFFINHVQCCQFFPENEHSRFLKILEDLPVGSEVFRVTAFPRVLLFIDDYQGNDDASYFSLEEVDGREAVVVLSRSLDNLVDRDVPHSVLRFRLVCAESRNSDPSSLAVTVYVEDVNDHFPMFVGEPYHTTVDELTPPGLTVFKDIQVIDGDKPNTANSEVHLSMGSGDPDGHFQLRASQGSGALVLQKALDYDYGHRKFQIEIIAADRGSPPLVSTTVVSVTVSDSNDQDPVFTRTIYSTQITETKTYTASSINREVYFHPPIYAYDQDTGINATLQYEIISGNHGSHLKMDHNNGSLFLTQEVDRESMDTDSFDLEIRATEKDNPSRSGTARVHIEVLDVNDNPPVFDLDVYSISIMENLPNGFSVLQVHAEDPDEGNNANFIYKLEDPSGAFLIDPNTGWLSVRDTRVLDRERHPTLQMTVVAKQTKQDNVDVSGKAEVQVLLLDSNDNSPKFLPTNLYKFAVDAGAEPGELVGQVMASDPDEGPNGDIIYLIQEPSEPALPFAVERGSGWVVVTARLVEPHAYTLLVEAVDQPENPSEGRRSTAVVHISVVSSVAAEPEFAGAPYEFWVGGDASVGTSVGQVRAEGVDEKTTEYNIEQNNRIPFRIAPRSGVIRTTLPLVPYFSMDFHLTVGATDVRHQLSTNVTLHVVDPRSRSEGLQRGERRFSVFEDAPLGTLIGAVNHTATPPRGRRGRVSYIGLDKDATSVFEVDARGRIFTRAPLDREERDRYFLTVIAREERPSKREVVYEVEVEIDDVNDNTPFFEFEWYEGTIQENPPEGALVDMLPVTVIDKDVGINSEFTVSIKGRGNRAFEFDSSKNVLKVKNSTFLDREARTMVNLTLVATDRGNLSSSVPLYIQITDQNDNLPYFVNFIPLLSSLVPRELSGGKAQLPQFRFLTSGLSTSVPIKIPEDVLPGTKLIRIRAKDRDLSDVSYSIDEHYVVNNENDGMNAEVVGSMNDTIASLRSNSTTLPMFSIHPRNGELSVLRNLRPQFEYILGITASDREGSQSKTYLRIQVDDVNNHAPVFDNKEYKFNILEGEYLVGEVGELHATDFDLGANGNVTYRLFTIGEYGPDDFPFRIVKDTGIILATGKVDRERKDIYVFKVMAIDGGTPPLNSSVLVHINVMDVNDHGPRFHGYHNVVRVQTGSQEYIVPLYHVEVPEDVTVGTEILKLAANDSDSTENGNGIVLYELHNYNDVFGVHSKNGTISIVSKLDHERQSSYNLTVTAYDLGSSALTSTALVTVDVMDVKEVLTERMFERMEYVVKVPENQRLVRPIVTLNISHDAAEFQVADDDFGGLVSVNHRTGSVYITRTLDREERDQYRVRVRVTRVEGQDSIQFPVAGENNSLGLNEVWVKILVTDLNDNPPIFSHGGRPAIAAVPSDASYGYDVIRLSATDRDIGTNADIFYEILPKQEDGSDKFDIDPTSGQVRSLVNFQQDGGHVYGFDVMATDRQGDLQGLSAICNVFVYVLDDYRQMVLVMGTKPSTVEQHLDYITMSLSNLTGVDVRARKLEPHIELDLADISATDLYLYAVHPEEQSIMDIEEMMGMFSSHYDVISSQLSMFEVREMKGGRSQQSRHHLRNIEVAIIAMGCVVFIGTIVAVTCVCCLKRSRKHRRFPHHVSPLPLGYRVEVTRRVVNSESDDTSDTYVQEGRGGAACRCAGCQHRKHKHSDRRHRRKFLRRGEVRPSAITSDSAIGESEDSIRVQHVPCTCAHATVSSRNSYEDSLKEPKRPPRRQKINRDPQPEAASTSRNHQRVLVDVTPDSLDRR